jgi:deoxyadenosine/deoxycytidine kinase
MSSYPLTTSPKFVIISVEALIGCGKSTLIRKLKEKYPKRVRDVPEPLGEWQDVAGHNMLNLFYEDKKQYAYLFQDLAYVTKAEKLEETVASVLASSSDGQGAEPIVIIMERSWDSDRNVFAKGLHDDGDMSDVQWECYQRRHDYLFKKTPQIVGHIKLEAPVDECLRRINKRSREEEKDKIPKEHMVRLKGNTDSWLSGTEIPVLTLDATGNFEEDEILFDNYANQIMDFVSQLQISQIS